MITLAAICLNEQDFIGHWLDYHYDSFDKIIICEGAARNYPPQGVTRDGLSKDATADIIRDFPDSQGKIRFVQHGWAGPETCTDDRVPAKMELRNACARFIETGYTFTLDVDEFLHPYYIRELLAQMEAEPGVDAYAIPQLHLWQNTHQFITGGYADVPHIRFYRWKAGSRYTANHNWPSGPDGTPLNARHQRLPLRVSDGRLSAPAIIHYGFCERKSSMGEKNRYYLIRGEAITRPATAEFRQAALCGTLPKGCAIHHYQGFLPFQPYWLPQ
jgi:hypothetical protein